MKDHHQGRLKPLAVPWCLGGETNFELAYKEREALLAEVTATRLTGVGFFDHEDCRVLLRFEEPCRFRIGHGFDEDDFISIYEYLRDFDDFGSDDDVNNEMRREWFRSGQCPNPYAYEVLDSAQLEETGLGSIGYRDYVLIGDDCCLNVIARNFTWSLPPGASTTAS